MVAAPKTRCIPRYPHDAPPFISTTDNYWYALRKKAADLNVTKQEHKGKRPTWPDQHRSCGTAPSPARGARLSLLSRAQAVALEVPTFHNSPFPPSPMRLKPSFFFILTSNPLYSLADIVAEGASQFRSPFFLGGHPQGCFTFRVFFGTAFLVPRAGASC